jgi:hypothetical protein
VLLVSLVIFSFRSSLDMKSAQSKKKKRQPQAESVFIRVSAEGFEPSTASLEGRCSIQLSYAPNKILLHFDRPGEKSGCFIQAVCPELAPGSYAPFKINKGDE